jgi:hypothetical protein
MKKLLLFCLTAGILSSCFIEKKSQSSKENEKKDKYDNAFIRDQQEVEKMKDPALGYVPYTRLKDALEYTEALKSMSSTQRNYLPLTWEERGPVYDSVGPSNGNGRGGGTGSTAGGYTSGRIRAFLLDTLNDPTGNTAITGGVAGGIWRCNNFLATHPDWTVVNDVFSNLAIGSICQDPTNPLVIYVATGEATSNSDAVYGNGVYKSIDGGLTYSWLPSTANFLRNYKVGCDALGNVYLACRITTVPVAQSQGLFRSTDGGFSWTDITPDNLTSLNNTCTDFEFTASGNLNAMFGYVTGTAAATAILNHRYTNNPVIVTPSTWTSSTGFRPSGAGGVRTEMAASGDVLYAITINPAYNTDSCYRSVDGGATWTKQNTTVLPTGLGSGQGWYNIAVAINPTNTNELIAGGLDAFRSTNGGATWTKFTNWVSTSPYVHADQHYHTYWITGGQTRMIMATDGGIFYSSNNGSTFSSKNKNLGIKQFYAGAIHPTAGSSYLLAGAQDNGTHQLKNPGLSYSIEVTGGDGCFVHINQLNPNIQYGSYVYNQYRRSTNGGNTWSSVNLSSTVGLFVNPFASDDAQNIIYCSNGPVSQIRRWINTNTATTNSSITFSSSTLGSTTVSLTSLKVSPYTANRVFFGTNNGRVFRLDNANTVTTATVDANTTQISDASFPVGTINCVETGSDENTIIAVYTNYGVSSVWLTNNGGTNWSAIEGNLPDMPIRWALFEPGDDNKIYLATDAGIYTTTNINGSSTQWLPESGFPPVRTDMLKMRASDSTIVAATHGRGLWTAKIPPCGTNLIEAQPQSTSVCEGGTTSFSLTISGPTTIYQWQVSTDGGANYTDIPGATSSTLTLAGVTSGMSGNQYRCITDTYCSGLLTSDGGLLTVNTPTAITSCSGNIVVSNTTNQCGAVVTYPAVMVTGSPAPSISYSAPSGSFFPVGTTTVIATATNLCATVTCSFTVTVNDTQLPTITCPGNITASNTPGLCSAVVNYSVPSAADNCPGVTVARTAGPASGSAFPVGTTTVTHRATDAAGNFMDCSFTITVIDTENPVIGCPAPITATTATGVCTAVVNYTISATDNCPGVTVTRTAGLASGSAFPIGTTTVTHRATDGAGNFSECSFTVIVLDGQLPVISQQPANRTVCAGTNATFSVASSNAVNYQWQNWNGSAWVNIAGANSASYTLNNVTISQNTNSYRVIVNGLCTPVTSGFASLYVNPLPTVQLQTSIPPVLLPADHLTITAVVSPAGGSFVWYKNGIIIPGATSSSLSDITVDDAGKYKVVYTDPNGCTSTSAELDVIAQASGTFYVFPNPNNGQFQVRFYNQPGESATIRIFDSKGAKVYESRMTTVLAYSRLDVNLKPSLVSGIYIVELINQQGKRIGTQKVIVKR